MDDKVSDADKNWEYLSYVLANSNADDDLLEEDTEKNLGKSQPRTPVEKEIQGLASPNPERINIASLRPGKVHIHGYFTQASGRYLRRGLHITNAVISDGTGSARVIWFNQPYKAIGISKDQEYELRGTFNLQHGRFQISNSKIRLLSEGCRPFERGEKG